MSRSTSIYRLDVCLVRCRFCGDRGAGTRSSEPETAAIDSASVISLDGPSWLLATDPKNAGRDQQWWEKPAADGRTTKVPGIIQEIFPGYHGVAWYWRNFIAPANPHPQGRYLLRFWQVDYLADVWVNGFHVGRHEGPENPFVFDVTEALKPGEQSDRRTYAQSDQ